MLRKTYAVVDLNAIANNIRELQRIAGTDGIAVVKGNAYGHGTAAVVKKAMSIGVDWFAVATPDEAADLREYCDRRILVLSPADKESAYEMVKRDISLCAFDRAQLEDISEACRRTGRQAKVHIKIDSGMNRIGLRSKEELLDILAYFKMHPQVLLEGAFTHFATADEADKTFSRRQLSRYKEAVEVIKEQRFHPFFHAANSAAILSMPEARCFDLYRMGIAMYGYFPSRAVRDDTVKLIPALSLISYVTQVKTIHQGDAVGYSRKFIAVKDEKIATVAVGYYDGYRRSLAGKAHAFCRGHKIQQVGSVCMDQIMFCVTGLDIRAGDEVTLIGPGVSAADLAETAGDGMIHYEILTGISDRVPRVYLHE